MSDRQLDLFSASGVPAADRAVTLVKHPSPVPGDLDDAALIAALAGARQADCHDLSAEAGRRGLAAAIPALDALCRRFKGFGLEHTVPEQVAALRGLAAIGTREAAVAVSRIIADHVVQGPGLRDAVEAGSKVGCRLPPAISLALLRHNEPRVRAAACRCSVSRADVIRVLIDLLDDLNPLVALAAACALGRFARPEARPMLTRLLREAPTIEVVDAVAAIADEDCIIQLGRIARTNLLLSAAAIEALEAIDNPRAEVIAAAIRGTA